MKIIKINLDYIKELKPCEEGIDRYITNGNKYFNDTLVEFLELKTVRWDDKKWVVLHSDQKLLSDNLLKEFALICALRAVERVNIPEITHLYDVILTEYLSGRVADPDIYSSVDSCAYHITRYAATRYAYHAINYAASAIATYAAQYSSRFASCCDDSSIEEEIQRDILVNLIEGGCTLNQNEK